MNPVVSLLIENYPEAMSHAKNLIDTNGEYTHNKPENPTVIFTDDMEPTPLLSKIHHNGLAFDIKLMSYFIESFYIACKFERYDEIIHIIESKPFLLNKEIIGYIIRYCPIDIVKKIKKNIKQLNYCYDFICIAYINHITVGDYISSILNKKVDGHTFLHVISEGSLESLLYILNENITIMPYYYNFMGYNISDGLQIFQLFEKSNIELNYCSILTAAVISCNFQLADYIYSRYDVEFSYEIYYSKVDLLDTYMKDMECDDIKKYLSNSCVFQDIYTSIVMTAYHYNIVPVQCISSSHALKWFYTNNIPLKLSNKLINYWISTRMKYYDILRYMIKNTNHNIDMMEVFNSIIVNQSIEDIRDAYDIIKNDYPIIDINYNTINILFLNYHLDKILFVMKHSNVAVNTLCRAAILVFNQVGKGAKLYVDYILTYQYIYEDEEKEYEYIFDENSDCPLVLEDEYIRNINKIKPYYMNHVCSILNTNLAKKYKNNMLIKMVNWDMNLCFNMKPEIIERLTNKNWSLASNCMLFVIILRSETITKDALPVIKQRDEGLCLLATLLHVDISNAILGTKFKRIKESLLLPFKSGGIYFNQFRNVMQDKQQFREFEWHNIAYFENRTEKIKLRKLLNDIVDIEQRTGIDSKINIDNICNSIYYDISSFAVRKIVNTIRKIKSV